MQSPAMRGRGHRKSKPSEKVHHNSEYPVAAEKAAKVAKKKTAAKKKAKKKTAQLPITGVPSIPPWNAGGNTAWQTPKRGPFEERAGFANTSSAQTGVSTDTAFSYGARSLPGSSTANVFTNAPFEHLVNTSFNSTANSAVRIRSTANSSYNSPVLNTQPDSTTAGTSSAVNAMPQQWGDFNLNPPETFFTDTPRMASNWNFSSFAPEGQEALQEMQDDPQADDHEEENRTNRNTAAEESNLRRVSNQFISAQLFASTPLHSPGGPNPSNTADSAMDFQFPLSTCNQPSPDSGVQQVTPCRGASTALHPQVMLNHALLDDGSSEDDSDNDSSDDDSSEPVLSQSKRKRGFNALTMNSIECQIASLATRLFSARLVAVNPLPKQITSPGSIGNPRDVLAIHSWNEAARLVFQDHGLFDVTSVTPSMEQLKLIKNRDVWIHGRFKNAARSGAVSQFGFKIQIEEDIELKDMASDNEDLLESLKTKDAFVFQDVILKALYNDETKLVGIVVQHIFGDLMPLPVIALVTTAIECALDEYDKGVRRPVKFKADKYHTVYSHHLRQLNSWSNADHVNGTTTLRGYQHHLITLARKAASTKPPSHAARAREDIPASRFC
ncbi:hypothetical protein V5O48_016119 [Marasmius crinis-equi]|uniref:DUF6532 domain-containing protein n=1 Tax=Marasmius crinis-equi TaxID=585013 RepID=A0ABR3ESN4_9AGAR